MQLTFFTGPSFPQAALPAPGLSVSLHIVMEFLEFLPLNRAFFFLIQINNNRDPPLLFRAETAQEAWK